MMPHIKYEKMTDLARTPTKSTPDSTGSDLFAAESVYLDVGEIVSVGTGLKFDMSHLPNTFDLQIRSRSGLAINSGIHVLNSPGTIDRDYRGEIRIILMNSGEIPYQINIGDKIAQLVIGIVYPDITLFPVDLVSDDTERGSGGFGSSGV